ncbi:hypothetical protein CPT_Slocum_038 [Serratia phage Slocum]|nr:hypothetical protein CPT_Slocum_038 [Serratia phage Slocum]URC22494.1 hypothetical protein KAMAJI_00660 [Serratia phage vB_SmaM-Kamaji]
MSIMFTISDKNAVLIDVTHGRATIVEGNKETSQQYIGTAAQTQAALDALHTAKLIGLENLTKFDLDSRTKALDAVVKCFTDAGMVAATKDTYKRIGAFTFDPAKQSTYGV